MRNLGQEARFHWKSNRYLMRFVSSTDFVDVRGQVQGPIQEQRHMHMFSLRKGA